MTKKNLNLASEAAVVSRPDFASDVVKALREDLAPAALRERLLAYHEGDLAAALAFLDADGRLRLCRALGAEAYAGVLEHSDSRNVYIDELGAGDRAALLSSLEAADAADYLSTLPKREREGLLALMDGEARAGIVLLGSFDADEIGSHMTTNYVSVHEGSSVREAMRSLIDQAAENDNISTIYVTSESGEYRGAIELKKLIIAREDTALASITSQNYPYVYASEEIDGCIERLKSYSEDSIPVLDGSNRLCGALTGQDIMRLAGDELGEDYARLGGLSSGEDLNEPLRRSIKKRFPWLLILLGLGLVVSSVVGAFEHVVAHLTLIVSFQSLVLDMAGNVGTQSLAVTIRVLMDKRVTGRQKLSLVLKETRVGIANGLALGVLSVGFIGLYLIALKGQAPGAAFAVSACTGIALLVSIILSSVAGTVIPIVFDKLHIDPAVASGPLITTVNDLIAVVTYYGLAWLLLINVLGL